MTIYLVCHGTWWMVWRYGSIGKLNTHLSSCRRRFSNNQSGGPFKCIITLGCGIWIQPHKPFVVVVVLWVQVLLGGDRSWGVRSTCKLIAVSESLELDGDDSHHIGASESWWLPFGMRESKVQIYSCTLLMVISWLVIIWCVFDRCPWECACSINTWGNRRNSSYIYNMLGVLAACRWLPFLWKESHGICL